MNDNRDHLRALFTAYTEVSGRALTLSHARLQTLREFDRRGFTAEDVRAVVGELDRRMRKGVSGYTEASLDWANAMGNVDRFEERLALIRQARARRRGVVPKAEVTHARRLPDGRMETVLAPATESAQEVSIREAVKAQAAAFRARLGGAE